MIIHIYSLIYILLLYILIERIIDLCFSLDCALGTQKIRPSSVTCWSLKSCQSCRSPDCHYRRVVSFNQETDECGDKYLLTFHSPFSLPKGRWFNRLFLASTQCFVGDLIVKLFFVEGRGRAFILEKQGQKFFL